MEGLGEIVATCNDGTNQASVDNLEDASKTMNIALLGGSTVVSVVNNAITINGWPCYTSADDATPGVPLTTTNVRKLNITTHASVADTLVFDLLPGSFGAIFGSSGGATVTAKATDSIAVRGTSAANKMKVGESGGAVYFEVSGDTKADIKIGGVLPTSYTFVLGDGADSITGAGGSTLNATHIDATATSLTPLDATRNLVVYGGTGNDVLQGGDGDDVLYGGEGDDTFETAATDDGSDTYHGGSGTDTVSYALRTASVSVDIAYSGATITGSVDLLGLVYPYDLPTVTPITVEGQALVGATLADAQALLDAINTSLGGSGSAWVNAANQLVIQSNDEEVTVADGAPLGLATGANLTDADDGATGEADDVRDDVENVTGGSGDDTLYGSRLSNVLSGAAGADTLFGGPGSDDCSTDVDVLNGDAGDDVFIASFTADCGDTLNGGVGTDRMNYQYRLAALTINSNGAADDGDGAVSENDNVKNDVEVLMGGKAGDTITGSNNAETLHGGPGNDTIHGGGGNDTLIGDSGDDTLNGDAGDDLFVGAGVTTVYDTALYTGETDQGLGADIMNGGIGTDKMTYVGRTAALTVTMCTDASATRGASTLVDAACSDSDGEAEGDNLVNFEWLIGGSGDDNLTGHTAGETIEGGDGADTLNGGSGDDTLFGDDGDDEVNGETGNDLVNGGAGVDILSGGDGAADVCQLDSDDTPSPTDCEVM